MRTTTLSSTLLIVAMAQMGWSADAPVPGRDPMSAGTSQAPANPAPSDAAYCANGNADNSKPKDGGPTPPYNPKQRDSGKQGGEGQSGHKTCIPCGEQENPSDPPGTTTTTDGTASNCTAGKHNEVPLSMTMGVPTGGDGGAGGCTSGCGSGPLGGGQVPLPVGSIGPMSALPDTGIIHWSRGNTGAYPLGDRTHAFDVPLTQGFDAGTGVATFQARLPQGGVRPTFTSTDGLTFAVQVDRGNSHGATMVRAGNTLVIRGQAGDAWTYTLPVDWQLTDNGRVLKVGTIARAQAYPVSVTYAANGEIATASSLLGTTSFTWSTVNGFRLVTGMTGPDGRSVTFAYSEFWNKPELASMQYADGSKATFAHDPTSRTLPGYTVSYTTRTETTPNMAVDTARIKTYWYDSIGRIGLVEDGMYRDRYWRPANNVSGPYMWRMIQQPDGSLHLPIFNGNAGRVANITYGSDAIDRFTLDSVKRASATLDELGRQTHYQYEGGSQFVNRVDYPDASYETWTRQPGTGQWLSHTDRLGRITRWERNATGLATAIFHPDDTPALETDNPVTRHDYNDAMQLVRTRDPYGRVTEYRYAVSGQPGDAAVSWDAADNHGYLVRIIAPGDAVGSTLTTTYRWNAATQDCIETIDPGNHRLRYGYDSLHRHIRTDWDDDTFAAWTYANPQSTQAGLMTSSRDRNGRVTAYEYDASGLRTAVVRPDGTRVDTTYDEHGRVATETNAGERTTYGYDAVGRRHVVSRQATAATVLTASTTYDSRNRIVAQTDPYGRTMGTVYDINDHPIRSVRGLVPSALSWATSQVPVDAKLADATWSSADIGTVGLAGSTVEGSGSVVLTAAGKGARSTQDGFRWYAQPFPGEGSITVYVDPSSTGRSGVMLRDGSQPGAPFVELVIEPTTGIEIHHRYLVNQNTPWWHTPMTPVPRWLRLTRISHAITAWTSTDGVTWIDHCVVPIPMSGNAQIGLCQSSGSTTALATASFSNLSVVKTNALTHVRMQAWANYLQALPRIPGANPPYSIEESDYDAEGQLLARTDGLGYVTTWAYDERGRVVAQTEAATTVPATTAYAYDDNGNRTAITSPRGIVTQTTYTERNLIKTITDAVGAGDQAVISTRSYTATGKVAAEVDALGRTTAYAYGLCCDRLETITDPLNFETRFTYDGVGNRLTVLDAVSHLTSTTYDVRNRPISVTNAALESTVYAYDDNLTDGVGIDAMPAVQAILAGLGLGSGADGSAVAVTDPTLATNVELRDGLGRVVVRIDALGHANSMIYDAVVDGLVETTQTDPVGHVNRARADGAGRVRIQIDAVGQINTSGFDATGNQIRQRDPLGIGWDAIYDARHRLMARTTTRQDLMAETSWSYDLDGNCLSETDAMGETETTSYDQRNRRITLVDRVSGTTRFAYDAVGNLISISDADNEAAGPVPGKTTKYAYDARNLLVSEAFPEGQQGRTLRVYNYDGARRLVSRQVGILAGAFGPAPGFAGGSTVTTYGYDAANRLIVRGYPDGRNDTFAYDAAGRLTDADSARYASEVDRTYDLDGRLLTESLRLPDGTLIAGMLLSQTWTVTNTYNDDNTLLSQTYPTGSVVNRDYTPRHELATVSLGGQRVVGRVYDDAGRLTSTDVGPVPGVLAETRTYLAGDHLVASIATPGVTDFSYSYDADGRKIHELTPFASGGGQTFSYDDAGRLTGWVAGAASQSWDLTKVGDWTSTTRNGVTEARVHTPVHEVTQVGPNIMSNDQQGNLTKDEHGTALAWDPENRLLRARMTPDASITGFGSVATYRYDALGRRIAKTVDGLTTLYLPAGAQTVVEIDRPALPMMQEDISGATVDGTLENMTITPASGGILSYEGSTAGVTRISYQPATTPAPVGFLRDVGSLNGVRSNGLTYGWSTDATSQAVVRHGAVPLVEFDTHITMAVGQSWSMAVPNGQYWVAVAAGDPLSTVQTNHFVLNGVVLMDPDVSSPPGYAAGDFDGWVVSVPVTNGTLEILAGVGALTPKLCWLEIRPAPLNEQGQPIEPPTALVDAMSALISKATAETGAAPKDVDGMREYVYGRYVDEVVAYQQTVNGVTARYYPHYNNLYSIAALTNTSGQVVERYAYDAYGKQSITTPGNVLRTQSTIGWDRGFTGYIKDEETGLNYAKTRMYAPRLGKFISRHPLTGPNPLTRPDIDYLIPGSWWPFVSHVVEEGMGGYIQNRYGLYDYCFNSPSNYVEPFSPGAQVAVGVAVGEFFLWAGGTIIIGIVVDDYYKRNPLPEITIRPRAPRPRDYPRPYPRKQEPKQEPKPEPKPEPKQPPYNDPPPPPPGPWDDGQKVCQYTCDCPDCPAPESDMTFVPAEVVISRMLPCPSQPLENPMCPNGASATSCMYLNEYPIP